MLTGRPRDLSFQAVCPGGVVTWHGMSTLAEPVPNACSLSTLAELGFVVDSLFNLVEPVCGPYGMCTLVESWVLALESSI